MRRRWGGDERVDSWANASEAVDWSAEDQEEVTQHQELDEAEEEAGMVTDSPVPPAFVSTSPEPVAASHKSTNNCQLTHPFNQ